MTQPMHSNHDCARAWDAMPWVLQGSAAPAQTAWLHEHLATCASCRTEFAQQERLQRAMSLPSDITLDAELGLRRLLGRLDVPEEVQVVAAGPRPRRAGSWFTRGLVAAVLVQAIGIGILGLRLWSGDASPSYRTLSSPSAPVAVGAIHVVPNDAMKLADWNLMLRNLRLQVVGGPNDVGAYTVMSMTSAGNVQHTVQQLRATPGIRLAEPVNAAP